MAGPEGPEDLNNFMIYPRVLPPYTDTPNNRDAPETHGRKEPLPISIHTCDHSEAVSPKTLAECRTDLHLSTPAAPRPPLISAAEDDDRNPQFAAPSADARVSSAPCSNTRCMASNFAAAFAAEPTSESQAGSVLDHLTALVAPHAPPKQLKASVQPTCVDPVGGRHIHGTIDSGCTGHVTSNRHWLINHRPCADTFRAAAGTKHVATIIGDMPVMARDRLGGYHYKLITNVRCVESFAYTLFSVTQLWAELRVDSLFADTRCCRLVDGTEWPYLRDKLLPTLPLVSVAGCDAHTISRAVTKPLIATKPLLGGIATKPLIATMPAWFRRCISSPA